MASGKRDRVVIACVTFDVAKIVDPAIHYEATRIHLVHFGQGLYREFFNEVCDRLSKELPKAEIVEHEVEVYNFNKMLNTVLTVISTEKKRTEGMVDIYVNVSAGTSEYSAAALMASMMADGVMPFNVPTSEFQVSEDRIKDVYYNDGRPIGMAKKVKDPVMISTYTVDRPDEKQVLGLAILNDHLTRRSAVSAASVIPDLAEKGLINVSYVAGTNKPDQNTVMNYQRNFMDQWIKNGWVERTSRRTIRLTSNGRMVLDVFLDSYLIGL